MNHRLDKSEYDLHSIAGITVWLRDQLQECALRATEIYDRARIFGINVGAIHKAATLLKVKKTKNDLESSWYWSIN
jgi:hypothetical protein